MRWVLTGRRCFSLEEDEDPAPVPDGFKRLQVSHCAICRTDAKMWDEGHRDLVFPRVPGHELVAADEGGKRFAAWPGRACGECRYCRSGRENLCPDMKIMGFHLDGGFSDHVIAPERSLVAIPDQVSTPLACFAEPVGCALHAIQNLCLQKEDRIIIYGGGTLGLIAALICQSSGAIPLVIEKDEEKIHKIRRFLNHTGIRCAKETTAGEFDAALNACPEPAAFNLCAVKLRRGGRFAFFSGLKKNFDIETNLLNLLHYKEIEVTGSYGLTRADMSDGLEIIAKRASAFELLIEGIEPFFRMPELMPGILAGSSLKYILDLTHGGKDFCRDFNTYRKGVNAMQLRREEPVSCDNSNPKNPDEKIHEAVIRGIRPLARNLQPAARKKIDEKTKPLGALGQLEDLALQMSLIQKSLDPTINRKALFVFAGDHGIASEGVSAYPAKVTGEMVKNILAGGAAINVLCRHYGIDIRVVDMGVNADFEDHPLLLDRKVRKGTRNFAVEEAMTLEETLQAVESGMNVFLAEHARNTIDIAALGEMGIANTTSASAIISVVTGISATQATGRGTGVDDEGLAHKAGIIAKVIGLHKPDPRDGLDILRKIGGYEIAGITGAALAAASVGAAVVLDGLISTAAGLVAYIINPLIGDYLISGHRSVEAAQRAALEHMGLEPVIDHRMRLGEGTGAAMAIDAVAAACRIMREMASFAEAGVSNKDTV